MGIVGNVSLFNPLEANRQAQELRTTQQTLELRERALEAEIRDRAERLRFARDQSQVQQGQFGRTEDRLDNAQELEGELGRGNLSVSRRNATTAERNAEIAAYGANTARMGLGVEAGRLDLARQQEQRLQQAQTLERSLTRVNSLPPGPVRDEATAKMLVDDLQMDSETVEQVMLTPEGRKEMHKAVDWGIKRAEKCAENAQTNPARCAQELYQTIAGVEEHLQSLVGGGLSAEQAATRTAGARSYADSLMERGASEVTEGTDGDRALAQVEGYLEGANEQDPAWQPALHAKRVIETGGTPQEVSAAMQGFAGALDNTARTQTEDLNTTGAQTELLKRIQAKTGEGHKLDDLMASYNSSFLTLAGKGRAMMAEGLDMLGLRTDAKFKTMFDRFHTVASQGFNQYVRDITGAQMNESEVARYESAYPTRADSPLRFLSKLMVIRRQNRAELGVLQEMAASGISRDSAEGIARLQEVYRQHGDQMEMIHAGGVSDEDQLQMIENEVGGGDAGGLISEDEFAAMSAEEMESYLQPLRK